MDSTDFIKSITLQNYLPISKEEKSDLTKKLHNYPKPMTDLEPTKSP